VVTETPSAIATAANCLIQVTASVVLYLAVNRIKRVFTGPNGTVIQFDEGEKTDDIVVAQSVAVIRSRIWNVNTYLTIFDDQGNTWPGTVGLQFYEGDFDITQAAPGVVSLISKIPVGGVKSFKVNYDFAVDGWSAPGTPQVAIIPADQENIPQGTWQMVGITMYSVGLTYAGAGQMALGIFNVGAAPAEDYVLVQDDTTGAGPCFFVDGGNAVAASSGMNGNPFVYTGANPATAAASPVVNISNAPIIIGTTGDGFGQFYLYGLDSGDVTAGVMEMEVLLKRVL
jgi:hypothetical protein